VRFYFNDVIASEAKQSIARQTKKLDCFVASAPRNDGEIRVPRRCAHWAFVERGPTQVPLFSSKNRLFRDLPATRLPAAPHWRSRSRPYNFSQLGVPLAVVRMAIFTSRTAFLLVLAVLCLDGRAAHAQAGPMTYWLPGGLFGFGGDPAGGQSSNTYGNFPSFDGSGVGGGSFSRTNFPNGWFVGGEGGSTGLSMNGVSQAGAFGSSLNYQGVQFGYNFKNSDSLPVTVYAGFDTLKYNTGIGNLLAPFDNVSATAGYSAHAGVEFKPTSNVSLSLGFGYTQQQSGRLDSDINASSLPGSSTFAVGGPR
jgi:opacity protein-like surface antigen